MSSTGFYEISNEELMGIDGGGFWSGAAYYAFVGGIGTLGALAGAAVGGPVGGVIGARLGTAAGAIVGGYVGDQLWNAAH